MPAGSRTTRSIALVAVFITVVSSTTPLPASAHFPPETDLYRAFFADDPDPGRGEFTILGDGDLRWIGSTDDSVSQLARAFDFYYASTRPRFSADSSQVTLVDFQRQQLKEIETPTSTSRWLESSEGPVDGTYIEDLTVSIVDVEGGVVLHAPGTSADGQYRIPNDGVVYTLTDFRVNEDGLPANHCSSIEWEYRSGNPTAEQPRNEENPPGRIERDNRTRQVRIDGDQWCYRYRLQDLTVTRSLWLGNRLLHRWNGTTAGVALVPYGIGEITRRGDLKITSEVSISEVVTEQHRDWNRRTGWQVVSESQTETRFSTRVTDSKLVHVSSNQELSVRQRVIELDSGRHVVALEFDGPPKLEDRRLWSRAIFDENQEFLNVWGVYSTQAPHRGRVTTNEDHSPRSYHFPTFLRLHMTARSDTPVSRFTAPRIRGYRAAPEVVHFQRQQIGTVPHEPGLHVNLTTRPTFRYDSVVVEEAPGPVTEVLDIHGDPIPLVTTASTYGESELSIDSLNESTVEIRLVSTENGTGLQGRIIHLSGTLEKTVRTDERGGAIVHPTRRFVTAEFRGDDWVNEQPVYHGPARDTARVEPAVASLMGSIFEFTDRLSSIGVLVVLSVIGWLWLRSR